MFGRAMFHAARVAVRFFDRHLLNVIDFVLEFQIGAAKAASEMIVNGLFLPFLTSNVPFGFCFV